MDILVPATEWHRVNYRKNSRTSRFNYNWNIQISKGCFILSFNCQSYYIGGKSFFTGEDFNVNWLDEVERRSLYNLMINENSFEQLISSCTTDNGTLIDHLYTNLIEDVHAGTLETYFSDHKAIWASVKVRK